jgi:hypothetical protein
VNKQVHSAIHGRPRVEAIYAPCLALYAPDMTPSHISECNGDAGPQLDVPHDVTPTQLETLLNGLLQNEEKMPYSFHIEDQVRLRCFLSRGFESSKHGNRLLQQQQ